MVRVIRQSNRGESEARNAGILAARAAIVAMLDSDNIWMAGKLAAQIPLFADKSVGFVFSGYETFGTERRSVLLGEWDAAPEKALESLLVGCCINTSTVIARRDWLIAGGLFDAELRCCQDHELWLRIAASGYRMDYVRRILVRYRVHKEATSANEGLVAASSEIVFERLFDDHILPASFQERKRFYVSRCYLNSATRHLSARDGRAAARALCKALRERPTSFRLGWLRLGILALWLEIRRSRDA